MWNFAGQDIHKGDFVGQIARTNQGMKYRVGVVTRFISVENKDGTTEMYAQVVWATKDLETEQWELTDGSVRPRDILRIDPYSITPTTAEALRYARQRGHA